MTIQPTQPVSQRRPVKPLDPNSERGKQVEHDFAVLIAGVAARLRREGKPLPTRNSPAVSA